MIAASPGWSLARAAVRAGLLAAAFVVAFVVWVPLVARSAGSSGPRGGSDVGAALATSLGPLALGLILGAAVGTAVAVMGAIADRLEVGQPWTGIVVKLVMRLAALPWLAISPFLLTLAWVIRFGPSAGSLTALEVVVIGGLVASLVAAAAYDPLRRNVPGAELAALGACGRGLVAGTGALVLIEAVANRPGLGRLLIESVLVLSIGGPLVATLLVIGLAGSLLALAGGPTDPGSAEPAPVVEEATGQSWWLLASVASLGVPVLILLLSFAVGRSAAPHVEFGAGLTPPSPAHPLGTDLLGQDLLTQLMLGYRTSIVLALGATLLAVLLGGAWGGLAALVAAGARSGGVLADVIVAPAWVVAVLPLLPAVILLRVRAPGLAISIAIGIALLARLALAVRDLTPPDLTGPTLLRAAAGVFLLCFGVAFVVGTGADAIGIGTTAPLPSLGRSLGEAIEAGPGILPWVEWSSVLTAGPCLFAAWSLLRPFNRGQTLGRLLA